MINYQAFFNIADLGPNFASIILMSGTIKCLLYLQLPNYVFGACCYETHKLKKQITLDFE